MTTLYRKYRPSLFSEISGQEHILQTLTNSIKNSQVSHAYLFTGPRGTGKTTTARIFAKTVNCLKPITKTKSKHIGIEPCNKCTNCKMILDNKAIDLIEIDAASHTGVDNIRQLKEAINIPPTNFKYKVYIIDEVHMLSIGAFNALLKTLEEPPAHAIFILATTELHKVPDTIISRCQQFNIKPLTKEEIINRLTQIAKKEKVTANTEALSLIATEAGGGMRDAESLLGQIISLGEKEITINNVQKILGISPIDTLLNLIIAISDGDTSLTIKIVNQVQNNGINLKSFSKQLLNYCRNLMLAKISGDADRKLLNNLTSDELSELEKISKQFSLTNLTVLIALLQNSLSQSNQSDIPQLPLEMALVKYFIKTNQLTKQNNSTSLPSSSTLKKKSSDKIVNSSHLDKTSKEKTLTKDISTKNTAEKKYPIESPEHSAKKLSPKTNGIPDTKVDFALDKTIPVGKSNLSINSFLDKWSEILEEIKMTSFSTAGFLKNCAPSIIQGDTVLIKANYAFNKDKLNEPQTKLTIEKIFAKIFKVHLKVKFVTVDELPEDISKVKIETSATNPPAKNNKGESSDGDNEILYEAMKKIGGKIVKAK
jgi:DNA polymerase-3 subunit gamma/tau